MLCTRCNKDVHPTRTLWSAAAGARVSQASGVFIDKCPDCGNEMKAPEPKTVSESLDAALVRLQGDIARLESLGALSTEDSELLNNQRAELARLVRRQEAQARKIAVGQVEIALDPLGHDDPARFARQVEESLAQQSSAVADEDDFIVAARRRLAALEQKLADVPKWESEARKLRAMLAAAEQA